MKVQKKDKIILRKERLEKDLDFSMKEFSESMEDFKITMKNWKYKEENLK